MSQPKQNRKAIAQSLLVFIVLFGCVLALTFFYNFEGIDLGGLLFLMSFLCCVFAAKNTYDVITANETSLVLAQSQIDQFSLSSEELYVQIYKNSPVPYLLVDHDGNILSANVAAVRMLDVQQKQVNALNILDFIESESEGHLSLIWDKFRSGISVSDEIVRVRRADHKEAWSLLSVFNFSNSDNESMGLMALVDITKQKRAEDAKSEFVSLASHQLRTPIAGMKWSAELLQMDNPENLSDRQKKYIDRLLISIRRLARLVDDFLRVSRFDLGTFQPEYETVNLGELFNDIIDEQKVKVDRKDITIQPYYDTSIPEVVSDPNLLRMIVTNLYTNAVKYTPNHGTIHIGYGKKDDQLIITVADNGMGIPAEDQDSIFTKLYRASNATRDVPDGTGLGLYIVKEAVQVLRGRIDFTSVENNGSTFEVVLPLEIPS